MHRHTLAPLETARDRVATESDQLCAERDAFEAFAERVASVPAETPSNRPTTRQSLLVGSGNDGARRLREAFRETVMAVDHYEAEYDEPLGVHAEGELGPEPASVLAGAGPVVAASKRALSGAVAQSIERRSAMLDHLDREAESLDAAAATLRDVVAAMDDHPAEGRAGERAGEAALADVDSRLDGVLAERQALLHERRSTFADTGADLCTYLNGTSGGWTYPVLSVVASLKRDRDALDRRSAPTGPSSP
jgi:hypothetical protein